MGLGEGGSWERCVQLEQRHRLTSRAVLVLHAHLGFFFGFFVSMEKKEERLTKPPAAASE